MADDMELRIAASEARTDTKFAQLLGGIETMRAELGGELKAMSARIAGVEGRLGSVESRLGTVEGYAAGIKFWVIGTGIAVLALAIAIFAFGNDRFGLGLGVSAIADRAAQRAVEQALPRQSLGTMDSEVRDPPASP